MKRFFQIGLMTLPKGLLLGAGFWLLASGFAFSQPYGNEWINFSQKYYKIPVSQNGVYRLDFLTLTNAGIPLSSFYPHNFQIFFRGQEQYIYVKGESDGVFNSSDYIEFYGKKNDGSLDSIMYKGVLYNKPVRQPNPYYSLFNDTSAYFLTWNTSFTNRRIIDAPDTSYSSFSPSSYFLKEDIIENHSLYYYGSSTVTNIDFPEYEESEGWSGGDFYAGGNYTATFNTSNLYSGAMAPNAQLKYAVLGESNDWYVNPDHNIQVKYKNNLNNYTIISNNSFEGYRLFNEKLYLPTVSFSTPTTDVVISALSGAFSVSRNTVPYVTMKFPHTSNLENKTYFEMSVPDESSQTKSYYEFSNFNDLSSSVYLYDFTNRIRIPITKNGSIYKSIVPNSGGEKFCVVKSEKQFIPVTSITPVGGGTGSFVDYSLLAVDSAFIIITHKVLMGANANEGVTAYANYRASSEGGNHNVVVADIDDLYEEFGYGIPKNPFSIRHFVDYCLDKFPTLPQNLFLVGKSVQPDKIRNNNVDPTGKNYAITFVPSIAYPTCDNMLVAGLNGTMLESPVPIGRLAAKNVSEVNTYLTKVKEYEHPLPDPDEWMKHAIFIGGGADHYQQDWFCDYSHKYAKIIEDTCFGGYGHVFCKNSSSPTQNSYSDSIRELINSGVSFISFFGHSSATVLEFNIFPPDQYQNINGKYPFFLIDGCVAGDIHQSPYSGSISSSEIYTLSNQGMIAVLASSGPGTPIELDEFTTNFYMGVAHLLYGKSVGKNIQEAFKKIQRNALNPFMNAAILELTLHGDPSIIIHSSKMPDYAITPSSVYFSPSYVSADQDSFDVKIVINNNGRATNDSIKVTLIRHFFDGSSVSYSITIPPIYYKDTLTIRIPVDPVHGSGLNKFEVHVNPEHVPAENNDNYSNNDIPLSEAVSLMIYSGDIIPVYPYKYAIVPNDTIMLKANTANPFASPASYIFEIDTTDRFNSSQKKTAYVKQMGSVVKVPYDAWLPSKLILTDSTVYFWRVRRDTIDFLNFNWRESSFQYIPNTRGWGQSHFFQFLKGDKFAYLDTNRIPRTFDFEKQNHLIEINTRNLTKQGGGNVSFYEDGIQVSLFSFISAFAEIYHYPVPAHVLVSVLDPTTGKVWDNKGDGRYGDFAMGPQNPPLKRFEFYTGTPAQQEVLRRFLQDTIPCGNKVILYTCDNNNLGDILGGNSPNTNPGLVNAFQSIGGSQFPNLKNNLPYILIGNKCGNGVEKFGDNDTTTLFLADTFSVKRSSGIIFSETVGPASKWNSMHWRFVSPEQNTNPVAAASDIMTVSIVGIRDNGTTETLIKSISKDSFDIYNLYTSINADTFPFLQLIGYVKDMLMKTPPQLKKWQVYYDGVPEVSLNPVKCFLPPKSTLQQGDSVKFSVAIENIGDYNMDSMWVDTWIYGANRKQVQFKSTKLKPLPVDSIVIANAVFSTADFQGGQNSLWIEANPFNTKHQLEQYHFNNIGTVPFTISVDKINPLLDVTFDGIHIMNGDIVSAKPNILINVKDENTFLAVDITSFQAFLKRPSQSDFEKIDLKNLSFTPAVLPGNNSCKINYTPILSDGVYQLKVQGKDKSGNFSGSNEYKISFEVINKPTVTHVLNYPNPFSTSTRFVFTLTGSAVPDYFKIQILTVTGKLVKEIDKFELGAIHIGRNITDYAWNGRDMFDDQLANGIYLYRVMTQLNGKSLEQRESGADPFFTQDYGKICLIR